MATIIVSLHVDEHGLVTGRAPDSVPPGDYAAPLEVPSWRAGDQRPCGRLDWPTHDCGAWPDDLLLRRENLYDDEGR